MLVQNSMYSTIYHNPLQQSPYKHRIIDQFCKYIQVISKKNRKSLNPMMSSKKSVSCLLALTFLLTMGSCMNFFNKVELPPLTGASCLDGSRYVFYYYQPDPIDVKVIPNKLLIYFEETPFGWCIEENITESFKKCETFIQNGSSVYDFGSSTEYAGSILYLSGILSEENGGEFNSWPKVLIKSCDGGAYMGNRDPIPYKGKKFHFNGGKNVEGALNYLTEKGLLADREEVVVGGSMNGGIAALMWSEKIASMTKGKTRVLADTAIHLNELNYKENRTSIQNRMQTINSMALQGWDLPNSKCQKANQDSRWKCLFGSTLIDYVSTLPIFLTQSLYDGWSIHRVLGYACAEDFGSLKECKEEEVEHIENYHKSIKAELKSISQKGNGRIGVFSVACVSHEFLSWRWLNPEFEVPMNSGNFAYNGYEQWKKGQNGTFIDEVNWPENTPCHGLKTQSLLREE